MKNLVGKKIRGFKYLNKIGYVKEMDKLIGEIGIITYQDDGEIEVKFNRGHWWYPLPEAIKHLVVEETPQERVARLEKELEQAKKNLKSKFYIFVYKCVNTGRLYVITSKNSVLNQECITKNDILIGIIEREY